MNKQQIMDTWIGFGWRTKVYIGAGVGLVLGLILGANIW